MSKKKNVFYPIIYVRGFALSQGEQNETAADPFCGFNLGSTVYRAVPDKKVQPNKFVFESPLVRLMSDFNYSDAYIDGDDIVNSNKHSKLPQRSLIIHRYYDAASTLLGDGKTPSIQQFARELNDLILKVRDLVCGNNENDLTEDTFRCYLVAHSMGGLICRSFLQNPAIGTAEAKALVDKVFTYATPHNGIEIAGLNVPKWFGIGDINNFNRKNIAKDLNLESLYKKTDRVDWLPEADFPSERFFCMVGTNQPDYNVAMGAARTFVGHGSDGLVRIDNASVWGVNAEGQYSAPSPTAYAYRSHSGYFGIVNSEEAFQNLTRFLFGDVRVDIWLDIDTVTLPEEIQGKAVDGLYQFEITVAPKGKYWFLTRRKSEENSVACRSHRDLTDPKKPDAKKIYLSTVFLADYGRVAKEVDGADNDKSLSYAMNLAIKVPDYEIDRKLWFDEHHEGSYLFSDGLKLKLTPNSKSGDWQVLWDWVRTNPATPTTNTKFEVDVKKSQSISIPFSSVGAPGITGNVRLKISSWS